MTQLWLLMLFALACTKIYDHLHPVGWNEYYRYRSFSMIFLIMAIVLGGYLGLRTNYNDTYTYKIAYEQTQSFPYFWETFNASLSADPGFNICNAAMKTLGVSTQSWLMLYALITIGLYLHFIRTNGTELTQNIYLFFCVGAYIFAGAAIKQSIATAICLCGLNLALEKKWIRYCLAVFIAMTFHVYAVIFLLVPLLRFKPWTRNTLILIIGTICIAFSLRSLLGTIVEITSSMGEGYTVDSFSGAGVNIFRVLVCSVPILLAIFYHREIFEETDEHDNLFFNLAMVNGCIMFIGIFGTANYFARLANFFVMAQAITLPWMINKLDSSRRTLIKILMIVGYLGFFYYSTNVVYGAFSMNHITIGEYLQQLF